MSRRIKRLNVEGRRSLCLLSLFAALLGCSEKTEKSESFAEPAYSKQYREHSVTAIVTLSETNIPTSGRIRLMIDVHAPAHSEVILPDLGNAVDPFTVDNRGNYTEPVQILPNGKHLTRRVWSLVPGLAGTNEFQSLEIHAGAETVKTQPVRVTVESLLPPGTDSFEIKDIAEPITLLPEQEKKRRSIYTVLGVLFGLIIVFLLISRLRKPKAVQLVLPHEAAFQSLESLPEDPVEKIHKINRILRSYYEARFGIPMIGKTLVEISGFLDDEEIIPFLERCEDLRFANKVPTGFTDEAEQFVRNYIERTLEVPSCD